MRTVGQVFVHKPRWFFASTMAPLVVAAAASAGDPKPGDPTPLLQVTALLQAPPGAKLDALTFRGKVVVLEFWATWCGPCIAAIPHLNALADKFKDQPVQFIAITTEEEETVKKFLAKRPIRAWIGLDTDKAMSRAYAVGALPETVLLGKDGKVAAITQPTLALEQHIKDLLAGKKTGLIRTYPAVNREEKSRTTFGATIERTLKIDGEDCDFLVLGTGQVLRHSCVDGDVNRDDPPTPFMQWVKENGVDVGFCASTNDYRGPFAHGHLGLAALQVASYQFPYDPVPLERIPSFRSIAEARDYDTHHALPAEDPLIGSLVGVTNIWDDLTGDQLLGPPDGEPAFFLKETRLMWYPLSTNRMPPIAFSTHEGTRGLVQITGFTANPPTLKLRYKLVREE